MIELIERQLAASVAAMQAVHDDETIHATLLAIAQLTANAMQTGRTLFVAGNGGSAADAQHLVADFVMRLTVDRPALRAVALTTDTSVLTAIGNDWGYEHVFSRQIEALGQKDDIFLAITTSGNSRNLLHAVQAAKERGMHTVAFMGNGGGALHSLVDHGIVIPAKSTTNIQEAHLALEHIFCMLVERLIFGMDFDRQTPEADWLEA